MDVFPWEKMGPSRPAFQDHSMLSELTDGPGIYDFLLVIHSNYGLISYRF